MEEIIQDMDTAETTDGFLDGWDDVETVVADETEEAVEEAVAEPERPTAAEADQAAAETPAALAVEPEQAAEPKRWELRHMDEVKVVEEHDLVTLAQKGLDYDRIRSKYDESKPVMELMRSLAQASGMTLGEYISYTRVQAKKAGGQSDEEARRAVALEDREAAVSLKEAEQTRAAQGAQSAAAAKQAADDRRAADVKRFREIYPDAAKDPKAIPQSVWLDVAKGLTLVEAYSKHAVEQANTARREAEHKAKAAQQNQSNAQRSTGSMKSAGESTKTRDPFLEGWGD